MSDYEHKHKHSAGVLGTHGTMDSFDIVYPIDRHILEET
jgi:hypothetical protein